jgi:hypothetical protein
MTRRRARSATESATFIGTLIAFSTGMGFSMQIISEA